MLSSKGISVVLGVLNEEQNVQILMDKFDSIIEANNLYAINELVFVDDGSKDATKEIIKKNADGGHSYRIKLVERNEKMGMVNACIVGTRNTSNSTVIIMDSDLQHPVETIPNLVRKSKGKADMIIASRYAKGGCNSWSPMRGVISRGAVFVSHVLLRNTRRVKDPASGYFMTDKKYIETLHPYANSYKLAMYILAANPNVMVEEVPFRMVDREKGSSKIVDRNMSFLIKYLIEVLTYWKVAMKAKNSGMSSNTSQILTFKL